MKVLDLVRARPRFQALRIEEPQLVFGGGHQSPDPKTGITCYGPWRTAGDEQLTHIRVAIVGTGETVDLAVKMLEQFKLPVNHQSGSKVNPLLFPSFPGMESEHGYACRLDFPMSLVEYFTDWEIAACVNAEDRDTSVEVMGTAIRNRLSALAEKETKPDVVIIALPTKVREKAGGARRNKQVSNLEDDNTSSSPQLMLSFMDRKEPPKESKSKTLHRVIKAEGMRAGLPTQLIWEVTLRGGQGVQDRASLAWNFCNALYYKAGRAPWRICGLRSDTCYVGVSFYRPLGQPRYLQTSMAQAFSDRGEGTVIRGERFEWNERRQGRPRLSRDHARMLVSHVLEQYRKHMRSNPTRLVLHKSSDYGEEELAGFMEGLEGVPFCDFLTIDDSDLRFHRLGQEPVLRGTYFEVAPRQFVTYSGGYIPFLQTYPGLRTPHPLLVKIQKGQTSARELISEILALTKMNWNSAVFAIREPITLDFSRHVGLILSELPPDVTPSALYRHYM